MGQKTTNEDIKNKLNQIVNQVETYLHETTSVDTAPQQLPHLQEMAVHCKSQDGYGFSIAVGSSITTDNNGGQKKEHNLPHAHIWSNDKKFHSRFQIVSPTPPKTIKDLQTVNENDTPLNKYADKIIEWCNKPPKRSANEGDATNWDAMRSSWKDIQDFVNDGLYGGKPHYVF